MFIVLVAGRFAGHPETGYARVRGHLADPDHRTVVRGRPGHLHPGCSGGDRHPTRPDASRHGRGRRRWRGYHAYGATPRPTRARSASSPSPSPSGPPRTFFRNPRRHARPQYASWQELVAQPRLARAAVNTTMDRTHHRSTLALLEAGDDVLLEKPMATTAAECVDLVRAAEQYGRVLQICHVLRYAPFFRTVHDLVAGRPPRRPRVVRMERKPRLLALRAQLRSRPWANSHGSAPMILTKCCHDLDLLVWMLGRPQTVASFGSLSHFGPAQVGLEFPEPLHRWLPDRRGMPVLRTAHLCRTQSRALGTRSGVAGSPARSIDARTGDRSIRPLRRIGPTTTSSTTRWFCCSLPTA